MQLSEQAKAALERRRKKLESIGGFRGVIISDEDSSKIADEMLRLFPVKTLNGMVIRWDDPITPERLVASGFVLHPHASHVLVCPPGAGDSLGYSPSCDAWSLPGDDRCMSEVVAPENMGEVWQLMAKCGCPVGGGE